MSHLRSDFGFACESLLTLASKDGELGGVTSTCLSADGAEGLVGEAGEFALGLACFSLGGGVGLDWEGLDVRSIGGDLTGH